MNNIEEDDDASYFDIAKPETEKVWCKIGEDGNLEYIDWDVVSRLAKDFDSKKPEHRSEQMLIGKLILLVREKTRREFCNEDKAG